MNTKTQGKNEGPVMVTGASGFIGHHLVRRLVERNHTVVAIYRKKSPEFPSSVYMVQSELNDFNQLRLLMRNASTVVHLAWDHQQTEGMTKTEFINGVNLSSLRLIIKSMEAENVKRLIFISTLGASEDTTHGFYQEKYFGELEVINSNIAEKIIVKPDVVWANYEKDHFTKSIKSLMKYPIYPVIGSSGLKFPFHIDDLTELIAKKVEEQTQKQVDIIHGYQPKGMSYSQIQKTIERNISRKISFAIGGSLGRLYLAFLKRKYKSQGLSGFSWIHPSLEDQFIHVGMIDSGIKVGHLSFEEDYARG